MNIICLDTETTGLNHYDDEILQLSIIDGSGAILFSEYVKPVHHECWTDAEKVNHISPSMVKGCKPLLYYAHTIQRILENADMMSVITFTASICLLYLILALNIMQRKFYCR